MQGVMATLSRQKRSRSKAVAFSDFFGAKVKTLLLRTRKVIETLPANVGGEAAAASLADLDFFSEASTFDEVVEKLGGRESLAAQFFASVTDESERRQLDLFARQRQGQQQEMILKEVQFLVQRAQELAGQLSAKENPLIENVLALMVPIAVEEDDEAGTGDQEESLTDEKKAKKKKKTGENKGERKGEKKGEKKGKGKGEKKGKGKGKGEKKEEKKTTTKSVSKSKKKTSRGDVVKEKEKEKKEKKEKPKKQAKEVVAVAAGEEEEVVAVFEEDNSKSNGLLDQELLRQQLMDAEREFFGIQRIAEGNVSSDVNIRLESPPNIEDVIRAATLDNVLCLLSEQEVALNSAEALVCLQVWWRIVKRSCQIHGVFELLRAQKSKLKTLSERYASLVAEKRLDDCLSFKQAYKYDRLGRFLAQFPLFVYQRKWTSLSDWFQKLDGGGGGGAVLIDCLPSVVPISCVFLKDVFQLNVHGFQVFPRLMKDSISDELVAVCKTRCKESGEVVFNNAKSPTSRHNDKKRVQLSTDKIEGTAHFKTTLVERLKVHFPRHLVDSMVALLSKWRCLAQLAHADYTPETLDALCPDDEMPLACLVALEDGTVFDVWPGAIRFDSNRVYKPLQIMLNKGDVLIFRGDLVHGGAAVEEENVRIHAYLDVVGGAKRPKHGDGVEMTYFMCDEKNILARK